MPDGKSKNLFVGRATEIGIISDAISGDRDGHGSVLLFAGEPGIGKSALASASGTGFILESRTWSAPSR